MRGEGGDKAPKNMIIMSFDECHINLDDLAKASCCLETEEK